MLDCVVVGAGPAGLTAAIYLARFRRSLEVLHDGSARAAWIPTSHNYPGFPDGINGKDLLARLTEQAQRYGASVRPGRVERLSRDEDCFTVETADERLRARTVLLATGVIDNEPKLPDVYNAVQRGLIRICPICDAYEATDACIGIIGNGEKGVREAAFLRHYSERVWLIHVGEPANLDEAARSELTERGIGLIETPIDAVQVEDGRIVTFTGGGASHRFDTLYSALGTTPRSQLAIDAGAKLAEDGRLLIDDHAQTSIPGLYAAGDLVLGLNQITIATAEAAQAATHIHNALRGAA
jgi:thioredoxin reductase (NADPH)